MFKKICSLAMLVSLSLAAQQPFTPKDFYADYKNILSGVYKDIDAVISPEERECVTKTGGSPVYGEITFDSVNVLLTQLNVTKDDVFYDLGSGLGKFIYQIFLMTPVKKAVGIEFSQSRFDRARSVAGQMPKLYKQTFKFENSMRKMFGKPALEKIKNKSCTFIKGCMLETDFSDATVIFTCSTCFGPEFMEKLALKCATVDKLRIITLKQFPYNEHVHYTKMFQLAMTWSSAVPVYMYTVDHSTIAPAYPVDITKESIKK
ncbi:MAG: hypothetical protein P4L31_00385 [Candidatus Babeliales bacterium]|nr:hypothetical protein [Candidatus Babeliales bacterium]